MASNDLSRRCQFCGNAFKAGERKVTVDAFGRGRGEGDGLYAPAHEPCAERSRKRPAPDEERRQRGNTFPMLADAFREKGLI